MSPMLKLLSGNYKFNIIQLLSISSREIIFSKFSKLANGILVIFIPL